MRRVRSKNTTPERKVRSLLHRLGFRFRLHLKDLPGKPDIVLPKHSSVIFVHGCFWHRHPGCPRATTPAANQDYWLPKFKKTVERDKRNQIELRRRGWRVTVVWECELRDLDRLAKRLTIAIAGSPVPYSQDVSTIQMAAEPHAAFGWRKNKRGPADTD